LDLDFGFGSIGDLGCLSGFRREGGLVSLEVDDEGTDRDFCALARVPKSISASSGCQIQCVNFQPCCITSSSLLSSSSASSSDSASFEELSFSVSEVSIPSILKVKRV